MANQENKYYIGLRKKIDIDYDSFGVIDDYLTNDNDIHSAALVYDFSTLLNQTSNVSNNEILLDTFGVLLFDIYGNFNLHKKLPLKVKFQHFMNFTQEIEIPEELSNIIGSRIPYIYECFHWSESIIDDIFLGKINKIHIDNLKEILISIRSSDSPIINDILKQVHRVLPENNITLFDYIVGNKNQRNI